MVIFLDLSNSVFPFTERSRQVPHWYAPDSASQCFEINIPTVLFSINTELKSRRLVRWKLSHDVFIKPRTEFDTQRNTKLIQDTFLALKGLTTLV